MALLLLQRVGRQDVMTAADIAWGPETLRPTSVGEGLRTLGLCAVLPLKGG